MADKRLIIAFGDSNCAGNVNASSVSSSPDYYYLSGTQTNYKIWNLISKQWENYDPSNAYTTQPVDYVGPEISIAYTANLNGGVPGGTDIHVFKASKYQINMLKWNNSVDLSGVAIPGGVDYDTLWPYAKTNFWSDANAGVAVQLASAVQALQAGGADTVYVDGMYIIMGTLDALAPYGSKAYKGLLMDLAEFMFDHLRGLGCVITNIHPDRADDQPVVVFPVTHDSYSGLTVDEEARFDVVRQSTRDAAEDLCNLAYKSYSFETVTYGINPDKVHYDLSGLVSMSQQIANLIYPTLGDAAPLSDCETDVVERLPEVTLTFAGAEDLQSNKIGVPRVTSYGSSYGIYGGRRLKDYDTPRPDGLNDRDAQDVVEFKTFDRTVKDYVLSKLGYPIVDVELDDFQINVCIDESISKLEYHAPDWMTQYATFEVTGGIGVYELPQPVVDNLNDVWYRRDFFKFGASPGSLEYDFAVMFFTNNGLFNNYNVSQYLLMQQYLKQVKNVLGQMSSWQVINNKYLHIWPVPESSTESVILEFRAFDPNTIHHAYKSWIQRYSLALAKEILGGIRGKYQTLPGPGGGTRLNGQQLVEEGRQEKQELLEELTTTLEGPPLFDIV